MNLAVKDFFDNGKKPFMCANISFWGHNVVLTAAFPSNKSKTAFLEELLPNINDVLTFLEDKKQKCDSLIMNKYDSYKDAFAMPSNNIPELVFPASKEDFMKCVGALGNIIIDYRGAKKPEEPYTYLLYPLTPKFFWYDIDITYVKGKFEANYPSHFDKFSETYNFNKNFDIYQGMESVSKEDLNERKERILKKLNELKSSDKSLKIQGAKGHQYKSGAVLPESQVAAFEQKHKAALPQDYRWFLLNIGNGGAGPLMTGLLELEDKCQQGNLKSTFPFSGKQYFNVDENEEKTGDHDKAKKKEQDTYNKCLNSSLILTEDDQGTKYILAVNGKAAGSVWVFDFENDNGGTYPLICKGYSMSFITWYEIWLDKSIEECKSGKLWGYYEFVR